jgi:hypothetical protein
VLERELYASPAEFLRGLRSAFPDAVEGGTLSFRVRRGGAAMEIGVTPGPDLAIAGLRLPSIRVRMRFTEGDALARARLLAYLDLATHRGGG